MANGLQVTRELLAEYLEAQRNAGLSANTLESYRRKLDKLYRLLPEDKTIGEQTLHTLGDQLAEEGYSPGSINVFFSAADGLLSYCGRYDLQTRSRRPLESALRPELSRSEYRWLLTTARSLGKAKAYFLIKCFATLGINPKDLKDVTVENVKAGSIKNADGVTLIPASFRRELMQYARDEGRDSGPLFLNRYGKPIERTTINEIILTVQQNTGIPAEKCNPRCLRKLCRSTQEEIQERLRLLMEREYDHLLMTENDTVGWYTEQTGESGK